MKQTAVRLPGHQSEWLAQQSDGISATVRKLVKQAMDAKSKSV